MAIDVPAVLGHGLAVSIGAAAILLTALRLNPRLFLKDQPLEHRRLAEPLSAAEKRAGALVAAPLLMVIFGGPIAAALSLQAPPAPTGLHAFGVGMVFNLFDWLVLDELYLGTMRPRWALMPGMEHVPFRFDHGHHARGFAVGAALFAVVGLAAAILRVLLS